MYKYNINVAFGNILRVYRESRGFSQEEFAELSNISRAYYGRVERGEHSPSLEICHKIANALGVRIIDLFNDLQE